MSDYSILSMLQRRMAAAMAAREPFPAEEGALRRRLAQTRENLRHCLGTMPDAVVSPEMRVEAEVLLPDVDVIQERIVYRTEGGVRWPVPVYRPPYPLSARLPGVLLIQGGALDNHSLPEFKLKLAASGF